MKIKHLDIFCVNQENYIILYRMHTIKIVYQILSLTQIAETRGVLLTQ